VAHAGHWAVSLLYFSPVVVVAAALGRQAWREKRAASIESAEEREE